MGSKSFLVMITGVLLLSACGIKGPLIPPSEIPAYEKKKEERLKKLEIEPQK